MTTETSRIRWLCFADLVARGLFRNRMTLQRWIRDRGFPPGVKLGANSRRWRLDQVEAWEAAQAEAEAARPAAAIPRASATPERGAE